MFIEITTSGPRKYVEIVECFLMQRLLRGMDTLMDCTDALDEALSGLLRPLIDQELSIVFYDLTTIATEGKTEQVDEICRYGLSKDGGIAR